MIVNYLKIAWRNIVRDRGYSVINMIGLAAGMAVALLIGLWAYDEATFDRHHLHYDRLAQVLVQQPVPGGITTNGSLPMPVSEVLASEYSHYFDNIAATWASSQNIKLEDKVITRYGCFSEPGLPEMLTMEMVKGTRKALEDKSAVILSESTATALFGDADPTGRIISLNLITAHVGGVYRDFPRNSSFSEISFVAPVSLALDNNFVVSNWFSSSFHIFVQLKPSADLSRISSQISGLYARNEANASSSKLFLNPMRNWHLYTFDNGVLADGRISMVRMVTVIGLFVLLLACINFTNLTTARSTRRMKEVAIRKTVGSARRQLVMQFFGETFMMIVLALVMSLTLISALFPLFNDLAGKSLSIPWTSYGFWFAVSGCIFLITLLAGSYPALYLSSFRPIKVLKGTFRAGRYSAIPRRTLVVVQFVISVVLIVGTLFVHKQVEHGKNRSVGYDRTGLLSIQPPFTFEIMPRFETFRSELLATNAVAEVSQSSSPTTNIFSFADNLTWVGKQPDDKTYFATIAIDPYFDSTTSWKIKQGRNFSAGRSSDSLAFIFNEAAIRKMGMKDPVGTTVQWHGQTWTIIGVVEDMVMRSPFATVQPAVFMMNNRERFYNVISMKLAGEKDASQALAAIESTFRKFAPNTPFVYHFADEEYALKFAEEERTADIASVLAVVAIVISCLGLIGLASFVAEQRTKEIGIRKVVGASVLEICRMITSEFFVLVTISCLIAFPLAWYFLDGWLQQFQYRAPLSWSVFVVTACVATGITLLSVGYQAVSAATANPVKSLRAE